MNAATGGVLGTLVATGRLSGKDMPVVEAVVNGRTCLCLVDTGSGSTMVSTRVVVGLKGRKARTIVTADGKSSSGKEIPVTVGLQGHVLNVSAIALPGLENLGVDCLLGDDVIDLMKGVTVKRVRDSRGSGSRYTVVWGKANHPLRGSVLLRQLVRTVEA